MRLVSADLLMRGLADQDGVILSDHPIVQHGHHGGFRELPFHETRAFENDVIHLPHPRRARGIHLRRHVAVDAGRLAVRVGGIFVAVQHLDLVLPVKKDTAVATALAVTDRRGRGELDVQLHVRPELVAGEKIAALRHHFRVAILHLPRRIGAIPFPPLREILPIKKHCCVARRGARFFDRARRARRHDRRLRTLAIMHVPFGAGDDRRVLITNTLGSRGGGSEGGAGEEGEERGFHGEWKRVPFMPPRGGRGNLIIRPQRPGHPACRPPHSRLSLRDRRSPPPRCSWRDSASDAGQSPHCPRPPV